MDKKNDLSNLQDKLGYNKEIFDDSIKLLDNLISSGKIIEKKRNDIVKTITVMTLGYESENPGFETHMDFDLSNDGSIYTLIFLRNLPSIGVNEEDNYGEFEENSFVGVTLSKND